MPLFFQHGLTANIDQVEALLSDLPGIRLISIDCPGHGKSLILGDSKISFDSYSDLLIQNMDALGIQKGFFGGISMGSGIALNIAFRYPERVLGLVLVRPAWLDEGFPENLKILLEATPFMNKKDGAADFKKLDAFKTIESEVALAAKSVLGVFGNHQQGILDQVITSMVADHPFPSLDGLDAVEMPTLVIANDDDPLHPYTMAEVIAGKLKNAKITKLVSGYIDKAQHRLEVRKSIQEFIIKNI